MSKRSKTAETAATQPVSKKSKTDEGDSTPTEGSTEQVPKAPCTRVVRMQRRNGVVVQGCDVYIGRQCNMGGWRLPKSKWFNPFTNKEHGSSERVIAKFEEYIRNQPDLMDSLGELRGKTLGCWCKPQPCHGDVLCRLVREKFG
eukprot:TRINITY_DN14627_c0_g1_i1.p2 TRINITY_DN14627_c0_g1~~TRINITY_DN14627_c0_g1_i1.p2  ORF type:complete len:144 (-),score=42.73 TRINITY_DN14627_c0_g1_i1:341-772(-)